MTVPKHTYLPNYFSPKRRFANILTPYNSEKYYLPIVPDGYYTYISTNTKQNRQNY